MRIVVAGFGNVLRRDDGFGVAVIEALAAGPVPDGVTLLEIGIGGVHLVQQLDADLDALIVLDAVELERTPGTVVLVEPDVLDVDTMTAAERRDQLADVHYATPDRALMLARGLQVLPAHTVVVGCQPVDVDTYQHGLTDTVSRAVPIAADEVRRLVAELGLPWPSTPV